MWLVFYEESSSNLISSRVWSVQVTLLHDPRQFQVSHFTHQRLQSKLSSDFSCIASWIITLDTWVCEASIQIFAFSINDRNVSLFQIIILPVPLLACWGIRPPQQEIHACWLHEDPRHRIRKPNPQNQVAPRKSLVSIHLFIYWFNKYLCLLFLWVCFCAVCSFYPLNSAYQWDHSVNHSLSDLNTF